MHNQGPSGHVQAQILDQSKEISLERREWVGNILHCHRSVTVSFSLFEFQIQNNKKNYWKDLESLRQVKDPLIFPWVRRI